MRLYRLNDSGEPVRDIQDRLLALGYRAGPDARGEFGEATDQAVRAFQRDRGLTADGEVGPETWRYLYEAGYRLGDRLLYLKRPMIRGEDVQELQSRLSQLGFDPGRVDGIFGPDSEKAVLEFQRNRSLTEDGTAGPEVITELRLLVRGTIGAGREAVREREWLRSLPASVVGARVFFDPACSLPGGGPGRLGSGERRRPGTAGSGRSADVGSLGRYQPSGKGPGRSCQPPGSRAGGLLPALSG